MTRDDSAPLETRTRVDRGIDPRGPGLRPALETAEARQALLPPLLTGRLSLGRG